MQRRKFEKGYFTGYYTRNVGEFKEGDLDRSINWFYGWISYLDKFVDLKNGVGRKVLEIGCSIGGASNIFYERGFEVHASDISKYAVSKAEKLAKKLKKNIFTKLSIRQVSFLPFFYKLSKHLHLIFPIAIKSTFINSPVFIIAKK